MDYRIRLLSELEISQSLESRLSHFTESMDNRYYEKSTNEFQKISDHNLLIF